MVKVTKIMPHGAYCELTEYGTDAYLPISEIASGWIKNIHEFIKEGQKTVAKVLSVDSEKGSIDISFKKTTSKEREDKNTNYNLEKRAEKLFDQTLKQAKIEDKKEKLLEEITKKVNSYSDLFNGTAENKDFLSSFIKNKIFVDAFTETVQKNTKPKKFEVSYLVEVRSVNSRAGVGVIKKALTSIESLGVGVLYIGAPKYRLTSEDSSYPKAEERIKESRKILESNKTLAFTMKQEKHAG